MSGGGTPATVQGVAADAGSFAQSNPELVAAGVVGVLVFLGVVYKLLRWWLKPAGSEFMSVLRGLDSVAVLTHPNPDPDAMACAAAVSRLADHVDTDVDVFYPGEIRHHQNRAFRTVLDLDLQHLETSADLQGQPVILVDHNVPRGFHGAEGLEPVAVVDHHPGNGTGSDFTDVRDEYGACATIIAEYLQDVDAELLGPDDPIDENRDDLLIPTEVTSALVFGILSDTSHLTDGCSPAEFEASAYLYPAIDRDSLNRIANPHVDAETLEVKARAISGRDVRPPYAVSDIGNISNVDAIPQAADELVNLETVTAVVVVGDDGDTIHLSGRSRDDRVHMGEVLEDVTNEIPMAAGGGHARMGGGQIGIDHMEGLGPSTGITREQLKERLFAAMSGKELAEQIPGREE